MPTHPKARNTRHHANSHSALIYTCIDPSSTAPWGCTTSLANAHANIGVTVIRDGTTSGYTVVSESTAAFAAHSIQVRYASDDFAQPTADSTTLPTAALPKTTNPPTLPTSDPLSSPPSPSFSTPAAIGIGIGSALVFVVLVGVLAFFLLRRRRSRQPPTTEDHTNRPFSPPPVPPKDPYRMSTYTHHTAATAGVYELSTPTTAAFPHRAGPFYHLDDEDDDKSTRTLTMGMGGTTRPGSSVGVGGGRSRTNTMRSEETAGGRVRTVREEEEGGRFPAELAGNAKVHVAELEAGRVVAELEGDGSGSVVEGGPGRTAVGLGIQRPQSLVPPPPIGGGGVGQRPVSAASSSAGWTVMRKEGVQATPWL